ncbi:MAG: AMP-binding protein [Pacificimonas sp.]
MMRVDELHLGHDLGSEAVVTRAKRLTYGALERDVSALAAGLIDRGLQPGERACIWGPKSTDTVIAMLAVMRAGGIAVPINPLLKAAQAKHILDDSGAALLIGNESRLANIAGWTGGRLGYRDDLPKIMAGAPIGPGTIAREHDDLAMLLYTSGSTGRPKGVMLTHTNICLGAESVAAYLDTSSSDRILAVLPLSFDYGLNQLTTGLRQGASVILLDYLTAKDVVKAVERERATQLAGVPPLWMQLYEAEWPNDARHSLRVLTNSGGHMPPRLSKRLRANFPNARLYLMYGLTEAFRSSFLDPELVETKPESVGTAIPNAELFIIRKDGSVADPNEPGELVHCGPLVAQGYWQDLVRTQARFRPAPDASSYGGTAVWSGDSMRRGHDGLLYFEARADEMIKTSGNRVSPQEIEDAALAVAGVREAVAFGVPDERLGQAIFLCAAGPGDAAGLARELKRALPSFMVPQSIKWYDELPRSPNGKLDRAALRARHMEKSR